MTTEEVAERLYDVLSEFYRVGSVPRLTINLAVLLAELRGADFMSPPEDVTASASPEPGGRSDAPP